MCVCKLTHRNVSTVLPHIDWNTAFRMFSTEHIKWAPSTLYGGRLISNIHVYVVCSYFWHLPIAPFENDWRLPFTKPFASIQFHFYYIIHEMYAHTNVAFFVPFFFVIPGGCYHPEFKCADNVLQSIWKLCGRTSFFFSSNSCYWKERFLVVQSCALFIDCSDAILSCCKMNSTTTRLHSSILEVIHLRLSVCVLYLTYFQLKQRKMYMKMFTFTFFVDCWMEPREKSNLRLFFFRSPNAM